MEIDSRRIHWDFHSEFLRSGLMPNQQPSTNFINFRSVSIYGGHGKCCIFIFYIILCKNKLCLFYKFLHLQLKNYKINLSSLFLNLSFNNIVKMRMYLFLGLLYTGQVELKALHTYIHIPIGFVDTYKLINDPQIVFKRIHSYMAYLFNTMR